MASVPLIILLPPPGPSAARRRPPVVPRALYQIINKAAGAVRVNILAGFEGHCRGGCSPCPPSGRRGPATPTQAPVGLPGSASLHLLGLIKPPQRCVAGWGGVGRTGHTGPADSQPGASGLWPLVCWTGPLGVRTWSLAIFLCAVHTPRTARPVHRLAAKQRVRRVAVPSPPCTLACGGLRAWS